MDVGDMADTFSFILENTQFLAKHVCSLKVFLQPVRSGNKINSAQNSYQLSRQINKIISHVA